MKYLKFLGALALAVLFHSVDARQTSAETTIGPRFFISNSLGPACTRDAQGRGRSVNAAQRALANLYNNNEAYIALLNQSTSLTAKHDRYSDNWGPILFNSYAAAAARDTALAQAILDGMSRLAASRMYLNEPGMLTRQQAQRVRCYENPNAPCPSHTPRFVARMYSNLFISAAVLQPFMTTEHRKVLLPWFGAAYKKFVLPEIRSNQDGIYDFANNGLAQLAYAALTNNQRLARSELSKRKREFAKYIQTSGYIRNNSYRGVRALWYHTYGLDPALSYALVAREWGQDFFRDSKIGPRFRAAIQRTAQGVTDYAAFRSVGNRGDSYSTNPNDRIASVHQFALNLPVIAQREYGISLPLDSRYRRLSRLESYSTISGLLASCYYSGK